MHTYILAIAAALSLISGLNAATWERPAGAYTPTNHSVNTTKYQTDRANNVAISSAKVDGDINKAFEGLNNIEARVSPNVTGQSGKYLTNNGAASFWSLISGTSISSAASASGLVLKSNGAGTSAFGLLDASSFPNAGTAGTYVVPTLTINTAGLVTAVTSSQVISASTFYASSSVVVSGTVQATGVSSSLVTATTIVNPGVAKAWVTLNGNTGAIIASYNVSTTLRPLVGTYNISYTVPMKDANYVVMGSATADGNVPVLNVAGGGALQTATGVQITVNNGNGGLIDRTKVYVVVFGQ